MVPLIARTAEDGGFALVRAGLQKPRLFTLGMEPVSTGVSRSSEPHHSDE